MEIVIDIFMEFGIIIIAVVNSAINARMAELADALDLESSSQGVQVRFLFRAPVLDAKGS